MDIFKKPFNKLKKSEIALLRKAGEERFDFFNAYFLDSSLQPFHMKWFEFQLNNPRTLVLGPRASWKCVSADSIVPTENGLCYMKDFLPSKDLHLPFVEPIDEIVSSCLGVAKATKLFSNGLNDVIEIETEDGFTLKVAPEHNMLSWDGNQLRFEPAGVLSQNNQLLFRCDWKSFAKTNDNPFGVPDELWFKALAFFYTAYPKRWADIWNQKHARKTIAQPLWRFFKHKDWGTLPYQLAEFLQSRGFGTHLIPEPLRKCTEEAAKIVALQFWWLNQHIKFSIEQAREVQTYFLNLGIPLKRAGSTLLHKNEDLQKFFVAYFSGDETVKYSEDQIIELATLIYVEISTSAFIPPITKLRAQTLGKSGFNFKPTLAAQFVSEFLDHAPRLRRYSFMFRFPFFLQRIKSFKYFETLTMDFTTTEGNYLVNGAIGHNSTVCGQHYAMWRTLRSPNLRVGIVSKSSLLASMFVSRVKHILETNEKVLKTWSDIIQPKNAEKWNNSEVTLIRPMPLANATYTALGVGTSLAGHHFDILIFDDVVDTDAQSSPILRKRVWDWFRFVAMQTLSTAEETQAHIIGTLYHPDDLYHHIINLEKEGKGHWKSFIQPALNEDGTSFWEDMFPLEKLQEIEATYGTDVFKLQYQNDPEFGGSGLTWDMFEENYYEIDSINVETLEIVQGVDLAAPDVVRRAGQSSFAIVVLGMERQTNKFFVLDVLKRVGVRMADQRSYIENLYTRYHHTSTIQMEAYAVQSYMHEYLAESEIVLPYTKVQTGGTKESRFEHILSLISNKRLYFRAHLHNELLEEIINFPNCSADLIDALYMAIKGFHREPKLRFISW